MKKTEKVQYWNPRSLSGAGKHFSFDPVFPGYRADNEGVSPWPRIAIRKLEHQIVVARQDTAGVVFNQTPKA